MLDFGYETLACPEIEVSGPAGCIVDLGYSECLWNNRVATRWQGGKIPQTDRVVLREGTTKHRFLQPRGFRHMMERFANPGGAIRKGRCACTRQAQDRAEAGIRVPVRLNRQGPHGTHRDEPEGHEALNHCSSRATVSKWAVCGNMSSRARRRRA